MQLPPSNCAQAHLPFMETLRMFRGHPGAPLVQLYFRFCLCSRQRVAIREGVLLIVVAEHPHDGGR